MRYILIFFLALCTLPALAQKKPGIYRTWVVCKTTYSNGAEMPDENPYKYSYFKYTFSHPNLIAISSVFQEKGGAEHTTFEIVNGILNIVNPQGSVLNTYKISEGIDTLILIPQGINGFDDPTALKYYLVPERVYQDALPIKQKDILLTRSGDTVYKASSKIYAEYEGDEAGFYQHIYDGLKESIDMNRRKAQFLATFIVSEKGVADSVTIIKGIDNKFDKKFLQLFNKTKKDWKPAMLKGKKVKVLMSIKLIYSIASEIMPSTLFTVQANEAFNKKDYQLAKYYYDVALQSMSYDGNNWFKRGLCRMLLGDKKGACEDWNKALELGDTIRAEKMIEKYCN